MEKLRIAMVGCGGIAGKHVHAVNERKDVEIVALQDVSTASIERFAARCWPDGGAPPAHTDAAEMYARHKPEAVVICTPHTLHHEHAVQALDAGCHVLMEKPMVTDLEQALDIEQRVAASGKTFCIAYNTPCSVEFHKLRELIRSGELGPLRVVGLAISQNWRELTIGSWRQQPELSGGGMIYDSGAHVMNSLVWSVESPVAAVHAFIDNRGCPVDINGTLNIRFENGVMATVAVGGEGANGSCGYFVFQNGRVEIDPWGASYIRIWRLKEQIKYPQMHGRDSTPMDNFVEAIHGEAEPCTTPRNGVLHSQLMDAVYESARTGQVVEPPTIPPAP